ncbi:Na+/H+ antiporter subunit B [soil metagenome]|jgi:multisubunit Na+/H+ antiporter MnhB subunit|nr:Na(+)/H(+) antiporter subunit B [Gemmatimonadota bacterium]
MRSLILLKVARGILPVSTLFALYLLLRGHNEPGGGFIAGLVTASAIVLQALAFGTAATRERLTPLLRPATWVGLLIAASAGLIAVFAGDPFLTHYHAYLPLLGDGYYHLSSTLLFDIGVYMVVVGTAAMLVSVFAEPEL